MTNHFAKITGSQNGRDRSRDGSDGHNNSQQKYTQNSDYIRNNSPVDTGYQTNNRIMQRIRDLSSYWYSNPIPESPVMFPDFSSQSKHDVAMKPSQIEDTSTNRHSDTLFSNESQPSEILNPPLQNTYFDLPEINLVEDHFFSDFTRLLTDPNFSAEELSTLAQQIPSKDATISFETSDETRTRLLTEAMQSYQFIEEDATQYLDVSSSSDEDDAPVLPQKKRRRKIVPVPQDNVVMLDQSQSDASTSTREIQPPRDANEGAHNDAEHFADQHLTDIFPNMGARLDQITDPTEKQAYYVVMKAYAQAARTKAQQEYTEIFNAARMNNTPIFFKWYGASSLIDNLVAIKDTTYNTVSIGPSKGHITKEYGIRTTSLGCKEISIIEAAQHINIGKKTIQCAIYMILNPISKFQETCQNKQTGPTGLYFTDSITQLTKMYGGNSSNTSGLYNSTGNETSGPWKLPERAIRRQSQPRKARLLKIGMVSKFPNQPDGQS